MKRLLQAIANRDNSFEFLLVKSGENLSIFSIIYFSISADIFVVLVTTEYSSVTIAALLILEAAIFFSAGFYYQKLYRKYELARNYVHTNSISPENVGKNLTTDEAAIFTRLKNDIDGSLIIKARLFYFIPGLGYFIGIFLFLFVNNLLPGKFVNINTLRASLQEPHTRTLLEVYNQFAHTHKFYNYQYKFINHVISKNKFDSCVIVDALCCYGKVMSLIDSTYANEQIKVLGCYDSNDSYNYCKDSAGITKEQLYNCPWANIDSSFALEKNCKLIYLLNNSLAEISDTSFALSVFKKFHKILTIDGALILDFENIANKYEPLLIGHKGIKRVREEGSKKKKSYNVEYRYYDAGLNIDKLKFRRPHYQSLMNKATLKRLLNEAGFSNVEFSGKLQGYPFEFIEAKK